MKKTKWLYGWGDWVVEVGRDEIWIRQQLAQQENGVQCDLSLIDPSRTVWKVAMYKVCHCIYLILHLNHPWCSAEHRLHRTIGKLASPSSSEFVTKDRRGPQLEADRFSWQ
jgi:hypothetical protein